MRNKRSFILLTLLNGYLIGCVGQNSSKSVVTHKVPAKELIVPAIALARRDRIPAGVIVGRESYCALVPNLAQSFATGTVKEAFAEIAKATGGSVTTDGKVLVLRVGTPPKRLSKALSFKFPRFPKVDGTLPDLGALLDGWMLSTLPENNGFGSSIGISPGEETLHLPESTNVSVQEVADKMVSLGSKGIWIAMDTNDDSSDSARTMSIDLYSYANTQVTTQMECP